MISKLIFECLNVSTVQLYDIPVSNSLYRSEFEPVVSAKAIKETNNHYYIILHTCRPMWINETVKTPQLSVAGYMEPSACNAVSGAHS